MNCLCKYLFMSVYQECLSFLGRRCVVSEESFVGFFFFFKLSAALGIQA